jgi:hypothetical protein
MRIDQVLRYGRERDPSTPTIDGLANWWCETSPPPGSQLTAVTLEAGIWSPAFRSLKGAERRVPVVVLRSSPHKVGTEANPWFDVHRSDLGYSRYYGDNKSETRTQAHETPGNRRMLTAAALHKGDRAARLAAPPVLVFEGVSHGERRKGQIAFRGLGVIERAELVVQRGSTGSSFTNFRYDLVLLDLAEDDDCLDWTWINHRRMSEWPLEACLESAPTAWRRWVEGGAAVLDRLRRRVLSSRVVADSDQKPLTSSYEELVLRQIYAYFENKRHQFELLADFVASEILRSQGIAYRSGWVTRAQSDGGVDFVGRIDLDPGGFASSRLVVLGQAKCETLERPTNGIHLARLAARLRRGWVGVYVTTSYFSRSVQREVLDDRYPVVLVHGRRVAEVVVQYLRANGLDLEAFLTGLTEDYETRVGGGDPDLVLL